MDSTTASDPFVKRVYPTVTDDGTFSATVDMSDVDDGTAFGIRLNYDGETLAEADGRIA